MGNYRFRLSDMIPNAWFYKLKDMSTTTKTTTTNKPPSTSYYSTSTTTPPPENHPFFRPKNSIYYTPKVSQFRNSPNFPHFHDQPRKSSKRPTPNRKTIYKPSPKHTESTQSPSSESTHSGLTCSTHRPSSSPSDDIIIELKEKKKLEFSSEIEVQLPPIITKPGKRAPRNRQTSLPPDKKAEESNGAPARKSVSSSGVKMRTNSPKLAMSKRSVQRSARRENLSESFAIVKSSFDPEKDFMQSMMEMITENNIRSSKDLEKLLACYLSLNSDEYHDVIVKAFEQIWFSLPNVS